MPTEPVCGRGSPSTKSIEACCTTATWSGWITRTLRCGSTASSHPHVEADRLYRVRPVHPAGPPRTHRRSVPPWLVEGEVVVTGRILEVVGLQIPELLPEQALLLRVEEAG